MKYLETFESFNTDLTIDFIYGRITESEFISYLESINENWISDTYERVKWKVIEYVWTFLQEAIKLGFKIFNKVVTFFKWIWNKIKSFKEKNPVLFKVITITIIIFLLLIIFASVAHAQTTGTPIDETHIKMAIGLLEDMRGNSELLTNSETDKSIEYLKHLKISGRASMDIYEYGQETINISELALKKVQKLSSDAENQNIVYCQKLLKIGSEEISKLNVQFPPKIVVQSPSISFVHELQDNELVILSKKTGKSILDLQNMYDFKTTRNTGTGVYRIVGTLKKF
jgi:hypothetical protein